MDEEVTVEQLNKWKRHLMWSILIFGVTLIFFEYLRPEIFAVSFIGSSGYASYLSNRLSKHRSMWYLLLFIPSIVIFLTLFGTFLYGMYLGIRAPV